MRGSGSKVSALAKSSHCVRPYPGLRAFSHAWGKFIVTGLTETEVLGIDLNYAYGQPYEGVVWYRNLGPYRVHRTITGTVVEFSYVG